MTVKNVLFIAVIYEFFMHVNSLHTFQSLQKADIFSRSHLSVGPEARERRYLLQNTAMLAKTERDSSTNLLIDLLQSSYNGSFCMNPMSCVAVATYVSHSLCGDW